MKQIEMEILEMARTEGWIVCRRKLNLQIGSKLSSIGIVSSFSKERFLGEDQKFYNFSKTSSRVFHSRKGFPSSYAKKYKNQIYSILNIFLFKVVCSLNFVEQAEHRFCKSKVRQTSRIILCSASHAKAENRNSADSEIKYS